MSVEDRIESLKAKHATLEDQLDQENARPQPDDDVVRSLKHEKLALKDQIHHLELTN